MKGSFGPGLLETEPNNASFHSKFNATRHELSISNSNFDDKLRSANVKPVISASPKKLNPKKKATSAFHQENLTNSPKFKNPFSNNNEEQNENVNTSNGGSRHPSPSKGQQKKRETFNQAKNLSSVGKSKESMPEEVFKNTTESYKDGSNYSGYKLGEKKHGYGVLLLTNGSKYEGDWKNDLMNGIGKLFYDNGALAYDGGFFNNKVDGFGTMFNDQPKIPNYNSRS
jgi:hypothetical protein